MTDVDALDAAAAPLVPYRLTICGLNELARFAETGVSHVLSILDPDWPEPEAFRLYPPHRRVVHRFDDVLAADGDAAPPEVADVAAILGWGDVLATERAGHVLVHRHAGVSRSTAAAVMLIARDHPGREAEAFDVVRRLRPRSWPNSRMLAIADRLLEREGALMAALREHQRRVAAGDPEFAALLAGGDRAHEILGFD
ncbi:MAG: tyrosine phosphatase family protein [Alphaproteobacteria bacterium]